MATQPNSIHDIAASLVVPTSAPSDDAEKQSQPPVNQQEENVDNSDTTEVNDEDDVSYEDDSQELDEDNLPPTEGNDEDETLYEEGEDEEEKDSEDDADSDSVLDLRDDDLIEVKIDGKTEYRSLADAKKALSAEGAYEKRVQEATEIRKQAQSEHSQLLTRFEDAGKQFSGVVSELERQLLSPTTKKPSQELKQANPNAYQQQLAAYYDEQERLGEGHKALQGMLDKQKKLIEDQKAQFRKEQAEQLAKALPALTDKEQAPKLLDSMLQTAKRYGFTQEDINNQLDHRYYLMVADLTKYLSARDKMGRKADTVQNLEGQQSKRPRKLRSGATTAKARAAAKAKQQTAATKTARQTGKVKDVAATLLKTRG